MDFSCRAPPKLAVVCVSGGALRSAVWTAVVLQHVERTIGAKTDAKGRPVRFADQLRIITGASGGMLGTAAYVARLTRLATRTGARSSPVVT